jgi:hypothetical protein
MIVGMAVDVEGRPICCNDGIWELRTNTVYNAETVAHVYKALWTVEDIFRTTKSILETRPIYHKRDVTIRGHVFCSFLALLLKQELESRIKQADLQSEWKRSHSWAGCLAANPSQFPGQTFSISQPPYSACFASGPRCGGRDTAYFAGAPLI